MIARFSKVTGRICCVIVMLGTPVEALADDVTPPRVRVLHQTVAGAKLDYWTVGRLVEINDQQVVLQRSSAAMPIVFPRSELRKLEISDGNNRFRNGVIGALAMAAVGAALVAGSNGGGASAGSIVIGALAGAPVGVCLGAVLPAGEAWREIQPLRRTSGGSRAALRLAVRF